jgi:RNA polymerase sigma-70 factor (ECF subfamily)
MLGSTVAMARTHRPRDDVCVITAQADYRDLVEPHRADLLAHCYRMLGSRQDAEDALQETLLRAWRGLDRFEGRSKLRTWLYTIATNTCLDAIQRRPRRVLPLDYGPASDPHEEIEPALSEALWLEPYPATDVAAEQRESLELAFVAALQQLPGLQRAALILREVLGFSAKEVAAALDTSVAAVNSALQRARRTVDQRRPAESQQTALRALGDDALRRLVTQYVDAWERGDVGAVVALLTEDATLSMPPMPTWFAGRDAIAVFFADLMPRYRWRLLPARANGQPAVANYVWDDDRGLYAACVLDVLELRAGAISGMTSFVSESVFAPLGLPTTLSADQACGAMF